MFKRIKATIKANRYRRAVQSLRERIGAGDRVLVHRGEDKLPATVMNVRRYLHGEAEVYVHADDNRLMAWVNLSAILPLEVA